MTSSKKTEQMKNFQVRMSDKALQELEKLREDLDATTRADVIRSSLKLTKFLVDEKKEGIKVILEDKDGNKREIIF